MVSAQKFVLLLLGVLLVLPAILLALYLGGLFAVSGFRSNALEIDACLDRGGCWDYLDDACKESDSGARCRGAEEAACLKGGGCWDHADKLCLDPDMLTEVACVPLSE